MLPNQPAKVISWKQLDNIPDWNDAPVWAFYLACDISSNWTWFQNRPEHYRLFYVALGKQLNEHRKVQHHETDLYIYDCERSVQERPDEYT